MSDLYRTAVIDTTVSCVGGRRREVSTNDSELRKKLSGSYLDFIGNFYPLYDIFGIK